MAHEIYLESPSWWNERGCAVVQYQRWPTRIALADLLSRQHGHKMILSSGPHMPDLWFAFGFRTCEGRELGSLYRDHRSHSHCDDLGGPPRITISVDSFMFVVKRRSPRDSQLIALTYVANIR